MAGTKGSGRSGYSGYTGGGSSDGGRGGSDRALPTAPPSLSCSSSLAAGGPSQASSRLPVGLSRTSIGGSSGEAYEGEALAAAASPSLGLLYRNAELRKSRPKQYYVPMYYI